MNNAIHLIRCPGPDFTVSRHSCFSLFEDLRLFLFSSVFSIHLPWYQCFYWDLGLLWHLRQDRWFWYRVFHHFPFLYFRLSLYYFFCLERLLPLPPLMTFIEN